MYISYMYIRYMYIRYMYIRYMYIRYMYGISLVPRRSKYNLEEGHPSSKL